MAKLKWALPCLRVITDRDSNNVTYVDAVEQMVIPETPAFVAFVVGTTWERSSLTERVDVRVRVVDPAGEELGQILGSLQDVAYVRHRANFAFALATTRPGRHCVYVEQQLGADWHVESQLDIDVQIQQGTIESAPSRPLSAPMEERQRKQKR